MDFLKKSNEMKKTKEKSDKDAMKNIEQTSKKGSKAYSNTDSFMGNQNKRLNKLKKRQNKLSNRL